MEAASDLAQTKSKRGMAKEDVKAASAPEQGPGAVAKAVEYYGTDEDIVKEIDAGIAEVWFVIVSCLTHCTFHMHYVVLCRCSPGPRWCH